jgi:general secretion pathway protein G
MIRSRHRRQRSGFTLIEVLLVLVILVILASFAAVQFTGVRRRANISAAATQVGLLKSALRQYEFSINSCPTTAQGLAALRNAPADLLNPAKWDGPYLESEVPLDPWDHPYQYASPGTHNPDGYDVWSDGPDGANGTEDDIGNWNLEQYR